MAGGENVRIIIKKKKVAHAGHHGGAWKVAYADFVTAMMALFMVLWLLTQADVKLRSQIARYFRDPGVLPGGSVLSIDSNPAMSRDPEVVSRDIDVVPTKRMERKNMAGRADAQKAVAAGGTGPNAGHKTESSGEEQARLEATAGVLAAMVRAAAAGDPTLAGLADHVQIQVVDRGLEVQVIDRAFAQRGLLFDLSSAELKPPLAALLQKIATVLAEMPNPVEIGGHTDARPFANSRVRSNWDLSWERASAARRVLEASGLRPGQIRGVTGHGSSMPLIEDDPWADENRRISIMAARRTPPPGVQGLPGPIVLAPDALPTGAPAPAPRPVSWSRGG